MGNMHSLLYCLGPLLFFFAPKTLNYLVFQSFDFQRTWWRLVQKRVVCTKFDILVFITPSLASEFTPNHFHTHKAGFSAVCVSILNFLCSVLWIIGFLLIIVLYDLWSMACRLRGYGAYSHFQLYFSCIAPVSFICGGNMRTRIKPTTCRKSLTIFITMLYTVYLVISGFRTHIL